MASDTWPRRLGSPHAPREVRDDDRLHDGAGHHLEASDVIAVAPPRERHAVLARFQPVLAVATQPVELPQAGTTARSHRKPFARSQRYSRGNTCPPPQRLRSEPTYLAWVRKAWRTRACSPSGRTEACPVPRHVAADERRAGRRSNTAGAREAGYETTMNAVDHLLRLILDLPPSERDLLRARLEAALADDEQHLDLGPEWAAEIARRVDDLDSGRVKGVSVEEAFARIDAVIAGVRAK